MEDRQDIGKGSKNRAIVLKTWRGEILLAFG
jgi:hypothetical protein